MSIYFLISNCSSGTVLSAAYEELDALPQQSVSMFPPQEFKKWINTHALVELEGAARRVGGLKCDGVRVGKGLRVTCARDRLLPLPHSSPLFLLWHSSEGGDERAGASSWKGRQHLSG